MNKIDKVILQTEGEFDSAHNLTNYNGKCSRTHGHRWKVVVQATAFINNYKRELPPDGILWDFNTLKQILDHYDHENLNQLEEFKNKSPSAEQIAINIKEKLAEKNPKILFKVTIYESPKSRVIV